MCAACHAMTWGTGQSEHVRMPKNGIAMQNRHGIILQLLRVLGVSMPPFLRYRTPPTSAPIPISSLHHAQLHRQQPVSLPCARFDSIDLCTVCEKASFAPYIMNIKTNNNDSLSLQQTKEKPHIGALLSTMRVIHFTLCKSKSSCSDSSMNSSIS